MLTPYPQIVEYNEAIQNPATAFRDAELRQGRVKVNALGLPVALSGGFALTYMLMSPRRKLAVRCFHREIPSVQQKYALIAREMKSLKSRYFVGFDYLPDGIRIRGGFYPVIKMDWAEGDPLGIWLDRNAGDRRGLEKLREEFVALAAFLEQSGIAHGDIQNGNVIISPAGLRLVDYDGVYVPGMPIEFGSETGHKHFQHPHRTAGHFGPKIDRFSFIAVDLSLAALIEDPSLHRRFRQGGETILFRANDFAEPENSEIFRILEGNPALREAAQNFAAVCRADIGAVPSLAEFRAGQSIPSGAAASPGAAADPAARPRAARYIAPCPVLRGDDFVTVERHVGERVELVGRVHSVRHGLGERGRRRGKPAVFVYFGPWRSDSVQVTIWADEAAGLADAPDESWAGRWISIVGLVEPPYTEQRFWSQYRHLGISTENPQALDLISEEEARFRLRRGSGNVDGQAPRAAAIAPAAGQRAAGGNRRIVSRLLSGANQAIGAAPAQMTTPPQPNGAGRSNQEILRRLRPNGAGRQQSAATSPPRAKPIATPRPVSPAAAPPRPVPPPATPRPVASPRASAASATPQSGSVVIHPRSRRPPQRVQPASAAAEEPSFVQRMLRYVGIDS